MRAVEHLAHRVVRARGELVQQPEAAFSGLVHGANGSCGRGGAAAGSLTGGLASVLGDAKQALTENLQQLNDVAETTAEMEQNASDFADMARQLREKHEAKSKGLGF